MLKIEGFKYPQHFFKTEKFVSAKRLYLPLLQHIGKPSEPCVEKNQIVQKYQIIARENGSVSAALHAPCKAKVIGVEQYPHPKLQRAKSIILEALPSDETETNPDKLVSLEQLDKESILKNLAGQGIVGMGGAGFPACVKLKPPQKIDTLIINGCECEPYLASDYRLMVENLAEIFKGIEIISKVLEPKQVIFAVEDNKGEAIKKLNLFVHTKKINISCFSFKVLDSLYPQGSEKQLIYSVVRRKVAADKLPCDSGCIVFNVGTCFAFYQALYCKIPLTQRLVTFCGDALAEPKNLWVNIGTNLKELVEQKVIDFICPPKKIIFGGPMMGDAVTSLDYPILKTTSGVLFLKEGKKKDDEEQVCIRCAKCINSCPMNLMPLEYVKIVKNQLSKGLKELYINDCIECGCCSYVCPARIPLLEYIKVGKAMIK